MYSRAADTFSIHEWSSTIHIYIHTTISQGISLLLPFLSPSLSALFALYDPLCLCQLSFFICTNFCKNSLSFFMAVSKLFVFSRVTFLFVRYSCVHALFFFCFSRPLSRISQNTRWREILPSWNIQKTHGNLENIS